VAINLNAVVTPAVKMGNTSVIIKGSHGQTGNLSSGTYTYTLYCNGKTINSRKMVIAK